MIGSRHQLTKARTSNPDLPRTPGPGPGHEAPSSAPTPHPGSWSLAPTRAISYTKPCRLKRSSTQPHEPSSSPQPDTRACRPALPKRNVGHRIGSRSPITRSILAKQEGCPSPALRLLRTTEPEESAPMASRSFVRATRVSRPHPSREPFSVGTHAELMQRPAGSFPLPMDAARRRRPESSWT